MTETTKTFLDTFEPPAVEFVEHGPVSDEDLIWAADQVFFDLYTKESVWTLKALPR